MTGSAFPSLVPELDVSDLNRSLSFYVGTMGFVDRSHRPEERFAYLEREGAHLMLEEAAGPGRRFRTAELIQHRMSDILDNCPSAY